MRSIFLFVFCIISVSLGIFLAIKSFSPESITAEASLRQNKPMETVLLPVFREDVARREIVPVSQITWVEASGDSDLSDFVSKSAFEGMSADYFAVSKSFAKGALLTWDGLVLPEATDFLARILKPGRRAIVLSETHDIRSKQLIYVGGYVDAHLSGRGFQRPTNNSNLRSSFKVAEALRVVGKEAQSSYILEGGDLQIQAVLEAQSLGRLQLVLRSAPETHLSEAVSFSALKKMRDSIASPKQEKSSNASRQRNIVLHRGSMKEFAFVSKDDARELNGN